MALNATGDLERFAWKEGARAACQDRASGCRFQLLTGSSETVGAKARAHTRETGHETWVIHRHITEYRRPEDGSDDA